MYLLLAIVHNIVILGFKDITMHIFFLVLFGNYGKCFPVFVWTVHVQGVKYNQLKWSFRLICFELLLLILAM